MVLAGCLARTDGCTGTATLQSASLTTEIPLASRKSIAEYGQISMHNLQPAQRSGLMVAVGRFDFNLSLADSDIASAAAAEAWATVSGISFGPWQHPAKKIHPHSGYGLNFG